MKIGDNINRSSQHSVYKVSYRQRYSSILLLCCN